MSEWHAMRYVVLVDGLHDEPVVMAAPIPEGQTTYTFRGVEYVKTGRTFEWWKRRTTEEGPQ